MALNYIIPFAAFLALYFALQWRKGGPIEWRRLAAIVGFAAVALVLGLVSK